MNAKLDDMVDFEYEGGVWYKGKVVAVDVRCHWFEISWGCERGNRSVTLDPTEFDIYWRLTVTATGGNGSTKFSYTVVLEGGSKKKAPLSTKFWRTRTTKCKTLTRPLKAERRRGPRQSFVFKFTQYVPTFHQGLRYEPGPAA